MLKFDYAKIDLPIVELLPAIIQKMRSEKTLIINAEAGAGKSTVIPLALLELIADKQQKIMMLEPRRLAAKSIANRMADLLGEKAGETVGYRIRFETVISEATKIEVVTEGILNKMMDSDPELKDVAIIIFDEFHERSIHADVALALARNAQKNIRPDLKLLIMSATLNQQLLANALSAPVIASKGRQYPVGIEYTGETDWHLLPEMCTNLVKKSLQQHEGDILVFLPGQGEILAIQDLLRKAKIRAEIYPLYGQLAWHKQWAAIQPHPQGKRKVVLATSIAETSLTIEGIKVVIDSGFGRNLIFDSSTALSSLKTLAISHDEADQRAGRAGRLSPGICYRMWSTVAHEARPKHRLPEILHADLANLKLDLAARKIHDSHQLFWLTPPPLDKLVQAHELLQQLDATDEAGKITDTGLQMHQLPCHPRLAHMLVNAGDQINMGTDLAALLEEKDPLYKKAGADITERINLLRTFRKEKRLGRNLKKIEQIAASYRKLFNLKVDDQLVDPYALGYLLALAYPDRIASAKRGNNAQFQLSNGAIAAIGHKDDLADESWLTVAGMDARGGLGKIFLAAPLNPKDLAPLVKTTITTTWDLDSEDFIVSKDLRIGKIILKREEIAEFPSDTEKRKAILQAIRMHGEELLKIDKDFEHLSQQIQQYKEANPDQAWPPIGLAYLCIIAENWLPAGIEHQGDIITALQAINLKQLVLEMLSPMQVEMLE